VEPTLNTGSTDWSYLLLMVPTLPRIANHGGESRKTHSKGKGDGIVKDGLRTSKQC
jgi:hypothetical protein